MLRVIRVLCKLVANKPPPVVWFGEYSRRTFRAVAVALIFVALPEHPPGVQMVLRNRDW